MAILNRRANTQVRQGSARFFDNSLTGASRASTSTGVLSNEATFINLRSSAQADSQTNNTATFNSYSFATAPTGFSVNQSSFEVYINGLIVAEANRTVAESGSNIVITFSGLGYNLDGDDKILLVGKFS
tara:strand:+ start:4574 stop:4960 length:387 start_codon:yes stop_codon:yes gene_type:complete